MGLDGSVFAWLMNMHHSGRGDLGLDLNVMNMHSERIGRASIGPCVAEPGKEEEPSPRPSGVGRAEYPSPVPAILEFAASPRAPQGLQRGIKIGSSGLGRCVGDEVGGRWLCKKEGL